MAKQVTLSASPRSLSGRNAIKAIRSSGAIPANVYGPKTEPFNLQVDAREIQVLLSHSAGGNVLVELQVEGEEKSGRLALMKEVQHHPVRGDILHVDFFEVDMEQPIEAEVPLEVVGEADGVRNYGGLLEQLMRFFPIKCLPQHLPEVVRVDVTSLGVGESLQVKDIVLPEGVSAMINPDVTVFLVAGSRASASAMAKGAPGAEATS